MPNELLALIKSLTECWSIRIRQEERIIALEKKLKEFEEVAVTEKEV